MADDREIEVKLKIEGQDFEKLVSWLRQNAVFEKETSQVDHYFDPPGQSFRFTDKDGCWDAKEFFRVRLAKEGDRLGYKYWHRDKKTDQSTYADEYEVGIGNGEKLIKILMILGFTRTALIEKERAIWRYQDFEFALDQVKNLGDFVEIEFIGKVAEPKIALAKIHGLLDQIKLKNWRKTKRGYCFIQWNPGQDHYE